MKVYFLPGLGFDHRIFSKFDLSSFDHEFINWIEPEGKESIQDYAKRLSSAIDTSQEKIVLVGQSLGGVMSQEIARWINIDKIVLISSIKSREELPPHFKIIERLNLHHFLTQYRITRSHKYWAESYGYKTKEEQDLFIDMVSKQTDAYLQWALRALSLWQTPELPASTKLIQIHGDKDKTLPIKFVENPTHVIKGEGHFMVFNAADSVEEYLLDALNN